MSPIHSLTIIAAGLSQFMAVTEIPPQSITGILEGVSKLGVTGILGIAIWYLKKQSELKDAAIEKRDIALEKKDTDFREYIIRESEAKTALMTKTHDVMQAVLAHLSGEETLRNHRKTTTP